MVDPTTNRAVEAIVGLLDISHEGAEAVMNIPSTGSPGFAQDHPGRARGLEQATQLHPRGAAASSGDSLELRDFPRRRPRYLRRPHEDIGAAGDGSGGRRATSTTRSGRRWDVSTTKRPRGCGHRSGRKVGMVFGELLHARCRYASGSTPIPQEGYGTGALRKSRTRCVWFRRAVVSEPAAQTQQLSATARQQSPKRGSPAP